MRGFIVTVSICDCARGYNAGLFGVGQHVSYADLLGFVYYFGSAVVDFCCVGVILD
eukprot:gene3223-2205_t